MEVQLVHFKESLKSFVNASSAPDWDALSIVSVFFYVNPGKYSTLSKESFLLAKSWRSSE